LHWQDCGDISFSKELNAQEGMAMEPMLPICVSERIKRSDPLMAAFKWHRDNVFQTPGGVRGMFGGSSTSSAKDGGAGGSQQGSHSKEEGSSETSGGTSSGEPHQRTDKATSILPALSASTLPAGVCGVAGLSAHEKVLLWDVGEAETVCAEDDESPNLE
jgi:hypothetical protein